LPAGSICKEANFYGNSLKYALGPDG